MLDAPALRAPVVATAHRFAKTLTAFGPPLDHSSDCCYGYSPAPGSADVTLRSSTNAYRHFQRVVSGARPRSS